MSRTREYEVSVVAADGNSGASVSLNATTAERAEKRARALYKGTEFHEGTYTTKEV